MTDRPDRSVFPPASREEMAALGWDECDVIIVTGDAYVDHPAFGSAVIARVLLDAGWRVGVIAQPDWRAVECFRVLGRPKLFFGITAGNVDSMVANYSPTFQQRREDDYAPAGRAGRRPNRAVTVYANLCRRAYLDAPLVVGGIEASLRRLAHYDYWDDRVRGSLLTDTRADILVYGMGERQVVEVARRLSAGEGLAGIPGTCIIAHEPPPGDVVTLPSLDEVRDDPARFNQAFRAWYRESDQPAGRPVVQPHGDRLVVQYPVPTPMTEAELDAVYELPYTRGPCPGSEPVPALATVRFSITSHRGCLGSCSFCSLRAHQGRIIQWRSEESILREAAAITRVEGFKGHITDVGGPTVNMYGATCAKMKRGIVCADRECTWPELCSNLRLGLDRQLAMLAVVASVPGIKHVTVGTGLRYDLLEGRPGEQYLEQLCANHVSGQLRVAPEHVAPGVLEWMRKGRPDSYRRFRERFRAVNERLGLRQYLIPYFISGHPGATVDDAVALAEHLVREEQMLIRQVQQYTPLPMTASAAAWHTGLDPFTGQPMHVGRSPAEQRLQRNLLQLQDAARFVHAERGLRAMGRDDLATRIRRLLPLLGHDIPPQEAERPERFERYPGPPDRRPPRAGSDRFRERDSGSSRGYGRPPARRDDGPSRGYGRPPARRDDGPSRGYGRPPARRDDGPGRRPDHGHDARPEHDSWDTRPDRRGGPRPPSRRPPGPSKPGPRKPPPRRGPKPRR